MMNSRHSAFSYVMTMPKTISVIATCTFTPPPLIFINNFIDSPYSLPRIRQDAGQAAFIPIGLHLKERSVYDLNIKRSSNEANPEYPAENRKEMPAASNLEKA